MVTVTAFCSSVGTTVCPEKANRPVIARELCHTLLTSGHDFLMTMGIVHVEARIRSTLPGRQDGSGRAAHTRNALFGKPRTRGNERAWVAAHLRLGRRPLVSPVDARLDRTLRN